MGLKRFQGTSDRDIQPLTPEKLILYNKHLDKSSVTESGIDAADWIAVVGLLRSGEYLAKRGHQFWQDKKLTLEKVTVGDQSVGQLISAGSFEAVIPRWIDDVANLSISLRIDAGKTDRIRKSAWVHVASAPPSTDKLLSAMCPVSKLLHHWSVRKAHGEVFTPQSPVFAESYGRGMSFLSYSTMLAYDKVRSEEIGGLVSKVRTHDRRKGGATALAALNLHHIDIKIAGRWSLGTTDFYIKKDKNKILSNQKEMLLASLNRFRNLIAPPTIAALWGH